jgi:hypothetical protein
VLAFSLVPFSGLVGQPTWFLVDRYLVMRGQGLVAIGTLANELEQLDDSFGFINPDLIEHVLVTNPMAEGGDDPKWVDL